MFHEIKTYQVTCDFCREVVFSAITNKFGEIEFPKDWHKIKETDCGLTGYDRTTIACPKCSADSYCKKRSEPLQKMHVPKW